jgi:hypothetical protein
LYVGNQFIETEKRRIREEKKSLNLVNVTLALGRGKLNENFHFSFKKHFYA